MKQQAIPRSFVEELTRRMVENWRKAAWNADQADQVALAEKKAYTDGLRPRFLSVKDVDRAVADNIDWQQHVAANQMYDRWATRDGTIFAAIMTGLQAQYLIIVGE
jgi:hypothetical protein